VPLDPAGERRAIDALAELLVLLVAREQDPHRDDAEPAAPPSS